MTSLTPYEDLAIEALIARHRLGETMWTFEARHKPVLERLARKGLVLVHHGTVENTIRAELSQAGTDEYMSSDYVAPILREREEAWRPPADHTVTMQPMSWQGVVLHMGGGQVIQADDSTSPGGGRPLGFWGEHMPPIQRAVAIARLRALADLLESVPASAYV